MVETLDAASEPDRLRPSQISIGQIELHVVGVGIGLQCGLEMLDGVVI